MITNMQLLTYETYYLDYLYSNRNFTAVFLRYRWLHGTDTLPVTVWPYTVVYSYSVQPYCLKWQFKCPRLLKWPWEPFCEMYSI